jgi:uncharacterized protein (TIGR03083 family)
MLRPLGHIDALNALDGTEARLLELLDVLSDEEWNAATIVRGWRVRDIAGHLLDTALRKLSLVRDAELARLPPPDPSIELRTLVDRLNAEGVRVYGRLSRPVLTMMMAEASRGLCAFQRALDPMSPAVFAVSWAGEEQSLNWFDTARELTERWHHQQQIRLAVDRPGIMTRELYYPVLDCFMRVLPFAYRTVDAPAGTHLLVRVDGESGGDWHMSRTVSRWMLIASSPAPVSARLTIPESIAWRVFTKGIDRDEALRRVSIEGDSELASHALSAVAIVG